MTTFRPHQHKPLPPVGVHTALSCSIREMPSRLSKPPPQHKQKSSLFAIHLDDEPRRGRSHVFLFPVPNGKAVPFLLSRLVAGCLFLRHPSHLHPRGPPECTGSVSPSVKRRGETERERREGRVGGIRLGRRLEPQPALGIRDCPSLFPVPRRIELPLVTPGTNRSLTFLPFPKSFSRLGAVARALHPQIETREQGRQAVLA